MKKGLFVVLASFVILSLAGCVTVDKVVRDRVDQDIAGNQGYLQGSPSTPTVAGPTTREYIDVKVEIPTWDELKKQPDQSKKRRTEDRAVGGNKGYIGGGAGYEQEYVPTRVEPQVYKYEETDVYESEGETVIEGIEEEVTVPGYTEYKVGKGDTLSGIAKKFYGKTSKWTVIYKANSDKIKNPDKIKPGTVLVIPDIEKDKSAYIK
jgi:nucleoid-associated protein YgaU